MATTNKTESLLGFAIKSGKIIFGTDNILFYKRSIYLILCDAGLSENARRKLAAYAGKGNIPVASPEIPLSQLVHRSGVKAAAVTDVNIAKAIVQLNIEYSIIKDDSSTPNS